MNGEPTLRGDQTAPGAEESQADAIAWSATATVGHIAVADNRLRGRLAAGLVDCRLTPAGKFRNGAARWWCVSHQTYWGVKADLARADDRCRAAPLPLQLVCDPLLLALPPQHTGGQQRLCLTLRGGAIDVHGAGLDASVPALTLAVAGLFRQTAITRLNVTPPALAAMAHADGCVDCARCGYPHLDLGPFAVRAHRRHTCGQCGYDATHSGAAMVSNPLYVIRQRIRLISAS